MEVKLGELNMDNKIKYFGDYFKYLDNPIHVLNFQKIKTKNKFKQCNNIK